MEVANDRDVFQKDATRMILEPIGRSSIGAEGIVDLYHMPGLGDVAYLYHIDGDWQIQYRVDDRAAPIREARSRPLNQEALRDVLREIMERDD